MSETYEGWAVVELMGHRRLAGRVRQVEQFGTVMLRLDVPGGDGETRATQFYAGGALYCVTPCDEQTAKRVAAACEDPAPVKSWELPQLRASGSEPADDDDDGERPW